MGKSGVEVVSNRFPNMPAYVSEWFEQVTEDITDRIVADIKANLWSRKMPIDIKRQPKANVISVGSTRKFYAGFLEYGAVTNPARPIVTPAAESLRAEFMRRAGNLEQGLQRG